jgi:hypothetical protein
MGVKEKIIMNGEAQKQKLSLLKFGKKKKQEIVFGDIKQQLV